MRVLIVEPAVKSIAPNIALMKWATWCENHGYEYQYVSGIREDISFTPDRILVSCIFSIYSEIYKKTILHYRYAFPNAEIVVGGMFPTLCPEWFEATFSSNPLTKGVTVHRGLCSEIESLPPKYSIAPESNMIVLYASRGCKYKCGYCAVPKLEGALRGFNSIMPTLRHGLAELPNASRVVLYDNNFTAHPDFDSIVTELRDFGLPVDFHGLHVSDFTEHQAERFAELKWGAQSETGTNYIRFSFDWMHYEKHIRRALTWLRQYNVKASFFCYMLFNWQDSPRDFWQRIIQAQKITDDVGRTIFLFPQRYEPLTALRRNQYIGEKWTPELAKGITLLYTFMHGFLPTTRSHNIFNWIGNSEAEFMQHALNFAANSKYKLIKTGGLKPTGFMPIQD